MRFRLRDFNQNIPICCYGTYPFGTRWTFASAIWIIDLATFRLWTLDTAGAILSYAARRVPFFETVLFDFAVENSVPAHARSVLGTQMYQIGLQDEQMNNCLVLNTQ